jgi:DNA-binding FadR family transcriptional regulator
MRFQPIDAKRLYEQVADQIGDMIRSGEFQPGQRLPAERDLSKSLGVSRPVVREAMIALEIAGLVEVRTGSGAYVLEAPDDKPLGNPGHSPTDILNARMIVEGEVAALAAERASERDLEAAAGAIAQMTADHDAGRPWGAADLAFHVAVGYASGNAVLAMVVNRLWQEQYGPVFTLLSERARLPDNWEATIKGHRDVLAAIRRRDPASARAGMRAHLSQVLEVVIAETAEDAAHPEKHDGRRTRAQA